MSLNATNFVNQGPIRSADMKQFVDLFTGVMTDQPVTFKNAVVVGGTQGISTPPLKLYGNVGQTGHLLDLYVDTASANPGWGLGASGQMGWGPGGAGAQDTSLSRIAMQNGHVSDTAGLLIDPYLEVTGNVSALGYAYQNGATITGPVGTPFLLEINQDLKVNRDVTVGRYLYPTSTASIIQTIAAANPRLSVRNTAANGVVASEGRLTSVLLANGYSTGTSMERWDTANNSSWFDLNTNGFVYFYAAAGTGSITWGSSYLDYSPTSQILTIFAGIAFKQAPSGGQTGVIATSGGNLLIRTNGSVVLQNVAGNAAAEIFALNVWASNQFIAGNAIGGFAAKDVSAVVRPILWMDTGNTTVLQAGPSNQIRLVNSTNGVQYAHWDASGYTQDTGMIRVVGTGSGNSYWFGTHAVYWSNGSDILWHAPGAYAFRNQPGTFDLFQVNTGGSGTFRSGLVLNAARGANQASIAFLCSAVGDANQFAESGNFYFWFAGASANFQGAGGAGWKPINASAFTVNSALKDKLDVCALSDPLSLVLDDRLHGISYIDRLSGDHRIGFVADSWLPLVPEVVVLDDGEPAFMDYARVGAVTFEALKQYVHKTDARLDALEARLAA